jgi:hypothetical protein
MKPSIIFIETKKSGMLFKIGCRKDFDKKIDTNRVWKHLHVFILYENTQSNIFDQA